MINKFLPLMDFYDLSLANGYEKENIGEYDVCFDMFFRPSEGISGFCIAAGLQQAVEYLEALSFSDDDILFLREWGMSEQFLDYLRNFKFECDIWAVPEGTPVFPGEPVVKVRGSVIQAQLIEAALLTAINHQTLVATKANRIVRAAQGRKIVEFGSGKGYGVDSSIYGARAAYIGGCASTSCAAATKLFDIQSFSGMSNSWVQAYDSEYEAFRAYARIYPDNCVLLIDTYDALNSGIKNAIKAFNEEIIPRGFRPKAVRIASGDLAYLSKRIRRILNEEGFPDCDIIASNRLDEFIIKEMVSNGARIDSFLVGEKLITASSLPVNSFEYKLCAIAKNGEIIPKINLSDNVSKISIPCPKLLWRLFDRETGKAIADLLTLEDEFISENEPYELFDPDYTWKRKTISNFVARQLLVPIFEKGKRVYDFPALKDIRTYCAEQVDSLWEEVLRFEYPHRYYVDFSQPLWDIRQELINNLRKRTS